MKSDTLGRGQMLGLRTLSGETTELTDDQLASLRMTFRGRLLTSRDDGYDQARVVQNGLIDRRPGLIVQCSGTADVIDAVNLARERQLLTAVRAGGHSIAGYGVCDGGLMIDLSVMRGVWVDPDTRTVRVQGGATWGDVDRETQAFGLAVPGGVVSTTGVAGLTLGGGIGWLHRAYGLACDNLRRVEIVTADGQLLQASEADNPELFWAVRGGGGNFGVVTSFEFTAHPLGPVVPVAAVMYPVDNAGQLFRAWRAWASSAPDEAMSRAALWWMPEAPQLPPAVHNQHVFLVGAIYTGPAEKGQEVLRPLRELGTPLLDLGAEMPFRMFQAIFDPFFPKGQLASYWKSIYLDELTDDLIDLIVRHGTQRPSPLTLIHVPMLGGAMSTLTAGATAFGDRGAPFMLSVDGNWVDPADNADNVAWVREAISQAEEFSVTRGTYLNFSGQEETAAAELVRAAYGENLQRLAEVKKKYDPENLFRLNNNIAPRQLAYGQAAP
jgi:FAD/FMN-containing dehydrogenase